MCPFALPDNLLLSFLLEEVLQMNLTFVYITREVDFSTDSRVHVMMYAHLVYLGHIWGNILETTFLLNERAIF